MRQHPIPPVTEPMQYRAIGLVNAVYVPQDEKTLTRGVLRCEGPRTCHPNLPTMY